MNSNDLIFFGVIAIIFIGVGIFYFFPDLFNSDNSFNEVSPPQTRFLDDGDKRLIDDPRYLSFDDPRNSICPNGFYIYGLTTENKVLCANDFGEFIDTNVFMSGVADCPAGQYLYGFNTNGTIDCRADLTGGITENINTQGSYFFDTNSWQIDINGEGKTLFIKDINGTGTITIQQGDKNIFIGDGNISISTPTGAVGMAGDQNLLWVGNDFIFCMKIVDQNGHIGFC